MKKTIISFALALVSASVIAQPCPTPNLVAEWNFDSADLSQEDINGWTGTVTGGVMSDPGPGGLPNRAARIDGGGHIVMPYDPTLNLQSWTISVVVRVRDGSGVCTNYPIVSMGTPGTGNHYSVNASNVPPDPNCNTPNIGYVFTAKAAGTQPFSESQWLGTTPAQNIMNSWPSAWHCVTGMYDGTAGVISLFVDGILYVQEPWTNQYAPTPDDLHIGGNNAGTLGVVDIDRLRIYDGVFSCETDVAAECVVCKKPPLLANWDFNDPNDIGREVVNGWPYTINGSVTPTTGINNIPNTAGFFDPGDFIQVFSKAAMDLESFTIKAVVNPESFYNGDCQSNAIVWRGSQYGSSHYHLGFYDNAFDNDCYVFTPNHEVFAGAAAVNAAFPQSDWLGTTPPGNPSPFIQTNTWYCVVLSYNAASEEIRLYVDGQHVFTNYWANQYNYNPPNGNDLFIGASNHRVFNYFFNGAIDDIKMYDGVFVCDDDLQQLCLEGQEQGASMNKGNPAHLKDIAGNDELLLFPNPADDVVTITAPLSWKEATYTIANSVGAMVATGTMSGKTEIRIKGLPAGVYVVTAVGNGKTIKKRLVVVD